MDPRDADGSAGDLPIPVPHDGIAWTPQGLGYDAAGDAFVHTMYDHGDQQRGLLAIQPADGGPVALARLLGNAHYGGVAVAGDDVYVSGNGAKGEPGTFVQRYSLAQLRAAGGDVVRPLQRHETASGSTLCVHDGHLYTARYRNGRPGLVHDHLLEPGGRLPSPGVGWAPVREWTAPPNLQGVARDADGFWVVRSRGVRRRSTLYRLDAATGRWRGVARLGVLSQGVVVRGRHLVVTAESGAAPYRQQVLAAAPGWLARLTRPPLLPRYLLQEIPLPPAPR
ncbi:hypothetical protein [Janibacter corallicola]|uniref:hypothetical protein n=1 Tax=Janibacter corallicola TaxID=415212 RepID=UPI000833C7AA|nr:hypothetical protein [Janibacter corallicola]